GDFWYSARVAVRPLPTIYIFQHIPKCGGLSFARAVRKWFSIHGDWGESYATAKQQAEFARRRLDPGALPHNAMVHGHFVSDGIRPHERYGDLIAQGNCRLLVLLRDPLERAVSAFYHREKVGRPWKAGIEDYVLRQANGIARSLGCNHANWRGHLDGYFFIGMTEWMQASVDLLAELTGNPRRPVTHINTSPRKPHEFGPEFLEEFRHYAALDYEIVEYARKWMAVESAPWPDIAGRLM
ncbi:MAG: hypothetical protein ACREKL_08580, partial [Chthoniobacterales bacterium]